MKKIAFLTGTRADFGKIKSLIRILQEHPEFETHLFVTGMHLQHEYGYTLIEVQRSQLDNLYTFENATSEESMDLTLAKTIQGFSKFVKDKQPDLIVVHGDRVEALAGAIVGSLNNILVAHIEGGEISGTIDEHLRHAASKMSHIHFVSNIEASQRLVQMGELKEAIHVIGSPDLDIMFSNSLPSLQEVKTHYEITFNNYNVVLFHPVTTEHSNIGQYSKQFVNALKMSKQEFVVIYPNNDLGSKEILAAYQPLKELSNFRVFPSIRFEYFLTLLKNANCIIGNSSAGIREAPYYGVPTINIGSRQQNRSSLSHIVHTNYDTQQILSALKSELPKRIKKTDDFGIGSSNTLFLETLLKDSFWQIDQQKQFVDLND